MRVPGLWRDDQTVGPRGSALQGRRTLGTRPPLSCFEASDTSSQGCQLLLAFVCPFQSRTRPLIPVCLCVCLYSPSGLCPQPQGTCDDI